MIGRIAFRLGVAALAIAVAFAQVDRSARFAPELAPLVPRAFSGFAAEQRVKAALATSGDAVGEARALVRRRPAGAEQLALLSLAAARDGDEPLAIAALEAASRRGWRVPMVQLASAQAALAQDQPELASQRIAALFAVGAAREEALALSADLLSEEPGRAAFARRLATRGHWQEGTLEPLSRAVAPMDFVRTMAKARAYGATPECGRLAAIADRYVSEAQVDAAAALREICAP